jgi:hypothetical protein
MPHESNIVLLGDVVLAMDFRIASQRQSGRFAVVNSPPHPPYGHLLPVGARGKTSPGFP